MNKWLSRAVIGFFAVLSANASAFQDIDNSIYFPAVAQGHGICNGAPKPQLEQYNSSQITGTNGSPLPFCSINDYPPSGGVMVVFARLMALPCLH